MIWSFFSFERDNLGHGPKKARTKGEKYKLFQAYEIILSGTFENMKREDIKELLQNDGALISR